MVTTVVVHLQYTSKRCYRFLLLCQYYKNEVASITPIIISLFPSSPNLYFFFARYHHEILFRRHLPSLGFRLFVVFDNIRLCRPSVCDCPIGSIDRFRSDDVEHKFECLWKEEVERTKGSRSRKSSHVLGGRMGLQRLWLHLPKGKCDSVCYVMRWDAMWCDVMWCVNIWQNGVSPLANACCPSLFVTDCEERKTHNAFLLCVIILRLLFFSTSSRCVAIAMIFLWYFLMKQHWGFDILGWMRWFIFWRTISRFPMPTVLWSTSSICKESRRSCWNNSRWRWCPDSHL